MLPYLQSTYEVYCHIIRTSSDTTEEKLRYRRSGDRKSFGSWYQILNFILPPCRFSLTFLSNSLSTSYVTYFLDSSLVQNKSNFELHWIFKFIFLLLFNDLWLQQWMDLLKNLNVRHCPWHNLKTAKPCKLLNLNEKSAYYFCTSSTCKTIVGCLYFE